MIKIKKKMKRNRESATLLNYVQYLLDCVSSGKVAKSL